jgi:hypothetical protein
MGKEPPATRRGLLSARLRMPLFMTTPEGSERLAGG